MLWRGKSVFHLGMRRDHTRGTSLSVSLLMRLQVLLNTKQLRVGSNRNGDIETSFSSPTSIIPVLHRVAIRITLRDGAVNQQLEVSQRVHHQMLSVEETIPEHFLCFRLFWMLTPGNA
eukprot:c53944_g1_i1.p2 GENE.c53944_g1_i1~~c53944_g1_i1.p2  ORF type:complete len:118 (+),score=8.66 c53944_g1_i1:720-1073(+)